VHWTSESDDSIVVFDSEGKFVRSWGKQFKNGAHGLHVQKEGKNEFLYICDIKRRVVTKTTLEGEEVFTLGYPKESPFYKLDAEGKPAIKYIPTNLAISPDGDIYVADGYGSNYILQYNSKGEYRRTFGRTGSGPGELKQPHGIWCDQRGKMPIIVVADRGNSRIQNFSLAGEHLGFVSGTNLPCHFHQYRDTVVVPDLGARVTLLNRANQVITHLGDDSQSNWQETRLLSRERFTPGKFICPHGAWFDHDGNIFVAEFVEIGRITKLRRVS
jgi:DNA-binding beta-propeller fold protein YncE